MSVYRTIGPLVVFVITTPSNLDYFKFRHMRLWDLSPSVWRYNGAPMEILHLGLMNVDDFQEEHICIVAK